MLDDYDIPDHCYCNQWNAPCTWCTNRIECEKCGNIDLEEENGLCGDCYYSMIDEINRRAKIYIFVIISNILALLALLLVLGLYNGL